MAEAQNYRNHGRIDPPYHYFLTPLFLLNVIFWIAYLIHHWPAHRLVSGWLVLMAIGLLLMLGTMRRYAAVVQDRVIRLEERIRYLQLLTPEQVAAAQTLTLRQIIALRFASDAELPALMMRALAEKLDPKAIKQSITTWRPDYLRV